MKSEMLERYILHSANVIREAQLHLYQANYETANGEGLDKIAEAIGLKDEVYLETDCQLRDRIREALK